MKTSQLSQLKLWQSYNHLLKYRYGDTIMITRSIVAVLAFLLFQANAFGASPTIKTVADQVALQGETYTYRPQLTGGEDVIWEKEYGPDDVYVNPVSGLVVWKIESTLPSESFHIGVRATNKDGSYLETWVLTVGDGRVVYIGPNETIKTIAGGLSAIESGDTLIMRDGVWVNAAKENSIPGASIKTQAPPSGTSTEFTTMMAENPGGVVIDGQGTQQYLIFILGSYDPPDFNVGTSTFSREYIAIKGIILKDSTASALRIEYAENIKFIDMGVENSGRVSGSSTPNVYIRRSNRILIEGLYSWGHSRYKMQLKDTTNSIVRRSVARIDDYRGHQPIGAFTAYCSKDTVFQNNIVVDGDHEEFWVDFENVINVFGVAAQGCASYPEGNVFSRNIGLNSNIGLMQTDAEDSATPTIWQDMVGWDLDLDRYNHGTGIQIPVLLAVGPSVSNRVTLGHITADPGYGPVTGGRAFLYSRGEKSSVTNSILYKLGWNGSTTVDQGPLTWSNSATGHIESDYNAIFGFTGDLLGDGGTERVTNNVSGDPDLKYIIRVEDGSFLENSGKNGEAIGANVTTFIGKQGTFYGDPGYNLETNIPMWPFPHEAIIRENMRGFSYTGPVRDGSTKTLTGARGFAVDGQTLTNYIWGYLGNTVPPFGVSAIPSDKMVSITWQLPALIDRATISQYRVYDATVKGNEKLVSSIASSAAPFVNVTGLTNDVEYLFYVTAVGTNGESSYSYKVSAIPRSGVLPPSPMSID
jgi:hypothetical protein